MKQMTLTDAIQNLHAEGATHIQVFGDAVFGYQPAQGLYKDSGCYKQSVRTALQEYAPNPWVIAGNGSLPRDAMPCEITPPSIHEITLL